MSLFSQMKCLVSIPLVALAISHAQAATFPEGVEELAFYSAEQDPNEGGVSSFLLADPSPYERNLLEAKPTAPLAKVVENYRRFTERFPAPVTANEEGAKQYARSIDEFLKLASDRLEKGEALATELKKDVTKNLRDQHLVTLSHFFELVVGLDQGAGGSPLPRDAKLAVLREITKAAELVKKAAAN
jgi:hypothetical protein